MPVSNAAVAPCACARPLRGFSALFAGAALAFAQVNPPQASLLRGTLVERDSGIEGGEFSVRGPESEVVRYRFDSKTRVVLNDFASSIPQLRPGEEVEVQSEAIVDSPLRYARAVHGTSLAPPPRTAVRPVGRLSAAQVASIDPLFPRGDLTFSGVVSFLNDGQLVLRTRDVGEQTILLRRDTRYLASGNIVHGSDLKANMRVFVRAGKDLFGHTEAYQVMWGGFLQPHDR